MARYFVTGATGFIGGEVARQLRGRGDEVVALVRSPAKAGGLTSLGVEVCPGDVVEPGSIRRAMEGTDGVFHLAGWYRIGTRHGGEGQRVNVDGTRNVLEAMRDLGIPKGVYTSTLAVNSDTQGRIVDESHVPREPLLSAYDRTKWAAHFEVAVPMMEAGLPLVIVLPGMVYGPGDSSSMGKALQRYLRRRLIAVPRGAAYCWSHVEDTARGHLLAMDHGRPGASYIIAGPPETLVAVLELAERITGIPAPRLRLSPALLKAVASAVQVVERVVPVPEHMSSEYLRVAAGATYLGSSARAQSELGFSSRPIEEGLRTTLTAEMARLGIAPRLAAPGG